MLRVFFSVLCLVAPLFGCGRDDPKPVSVIKVDSGAPLVVFLGGSEGGYPGAPWLVDTFTRQSISVAQIAYFGVPDGPRHLQEIDIDQVASAIKTFGASHTCIGIFGVSKGAELALLLAAHHDLSDVTVAMVPSHVAWQSSRVSLAKRSSWTLGSAPLPFVPYDTFSWKAVRAAFAVESALGLHEDALLDAKAVADANIRVENIKQPVLLQGAMRDQIWPSSKMADKIIARADRLNPTHKISVTHYDHDHYLLSHAAAVNDLVQFISAPLLDCENAI